MLQFIMEQNLLLYVCGVACALGVISQFLLKHLYERLISETQNTGEPKGKFLRQMRQRFQNCRHLNEKVNDITSFTDRSIMDYEFLKMNLHQWQRIGKEALTICLLCCSMGLWLLYRNGGTVSIGTSYSKAALVSVLLIGLTYGITDNKYRHRSLKIRVMDYLQNSGAVKEYGEVDFPDVVSEGMPANSFAASGVSQGAQEAAAETASASNTTTVSIGKKLRRSSRGNGETRAQKEKRQLKENLTRDKLNMQETAAAQEGDSDRENNRNLLRQMDPKEKEQILREVLLEFLT